MPLAIYESNFLIFILQYKVHETMFHEKLLTIFSIVGAGIKEIPEHSTPIYIHIELQSRPDYKLLPSD